MTDQDRPTHPDLVALLRYELSNAEAARAGEHLDECDECRADLGDLVVGSSVMGRAARTLAAAPSGAPGIPATSGPLGVGDLPPLTPPGRLRAPRERWLLGAAAAVVVASIGALALGLVRGDGADRLPQAAPAASQSAPATPSTSANPSGAARSVLLGPVTGQPEAGSPAGRVDLVQGEDATTLTFAPRDLPESRADEFFEAWLLDPSTDKMLPLGVVSDTGATTFAVSNVLLDQYAALDLSLEADDGDPSHSAVSVLRGTY